MLASSLRTALPSGGLGRVLALVVSVKLVVIFVLLRLLLMPDTLRQRAGHGGEADYVATQLERQPSP